MNTKMLKLMELAGGGKQKNKMRGKKDVAEFNNAKTESWNENIEKRLKI